MALIAGYYLLSTKAAQRRLIYSVVILALSYFTTAESARALFNFSQQPFNVSAPAFHTGSAGLSMMIGH